MPPYTDRLRRRPEEGRLRLPAVHPQQDRSGRSSPTTGGDAATLIKNFKWTNADQNPVADYITNKSMTAEEAAKKWVDANESVWKAWMP